MKKLFFFFTLMLTAVGFAQGKVHFRAEIANRNGDVIYINTMSNKTIKEIKVNDKGVFDASFEAADGDYMMYDGVEYAQLFLKDGYDLSLKMDAAQFDESIVFKGKGEAENNFLAQSTILDEKLDPNALLALDQEAFTKAVDQKQQGDLERLEKAKLDPKFTESQKQSIVQNLMGLKQYYNQKQAANKLSGGASATFEYENHKGGKTKLEDLRGKYVYIDVWATWCGPCRAENPAVVAAYNKYHALNFKNGKGFEILSVSLDQNEVAWVKAIEKDKLVWLYHVSDLQGWSNAAAMRYGVNSIPTNVLVDANGIIVAKNLRGEALEKALEAQLK